MGRIRGDLGERTIQFALRVLDLHDGLPNSPKGWVIGKQFIRSGTSIGSNICEANHALTDADFTHKCSLARKEASETHYWLTLCKRGKLLSGGELDSMIDEADQLVRILVTLVRTNQDRRAGES